MAGPRVLTQYGNIVVVPETSIIYTVMFINYIHLQYINFNAPDFLGVALSITECTMPEISLNKMPECLYGQAFQWLNRKLTCWAWIVQVSHLRLLFWASCQTKTIFKLDFSSWAGKSQTNNITLQRAIKLRLLLLYRPHGNSIPHLWSPFLVIVLLFLLCKIRNILSETYCIVLKLKSFRKPAGFFSKLQVSVLVPFFEHF